MKTLNLRLKRFPDGNAVSEKRCKGTHKFANHQTFCRFFCLPRFFLPERYGFAMREIGYRIVAKAYPHLG